MTSGNSEMAYWFPAANKLYYRSVTMAFNCMTGYAPEYLSSRFLKRAEVSGSSIRNSQLLNIPLFGRTYLCLTYVTEKRGGPQAGWRLDGSSSCAKCFTEGEWGKITVAKNVIQAAP